MYRSTLFSMTSRRVVAASVVAVSLALAACSDDAATGPETPSVARQVPQPSAAFLKVAAFVTVRIADTTGTTLKEDGWIRFNASPDDTIYVRDNSANDLDPTIGVIKVAMAKASSYQACFTMSQHYLPDFVANAAKFPSCKFVMSSALNVDLGTVIGQRRPMVKIFTRNQFGTLVGGATFDWYTPSADHHHTWTDGNASYDESPGADGIVIYSLGYPGQELDVCEVSPPPKTVLASSTACHPMVPKWGQTYTFTYYHEQQIF